MTTSVGEARWLDAPDAAEPSEVDPEHSLQAICAQPLGFPRLSGPFGAAQVPVGSCSYGRRLADDISGWYRDLLTGSYDWVDRIVPNAYLTKGYARGRFRV